MKMLYFSVTLMLALLGATAYLALQARDEAVKANVKMDLLTQQQRTATSQNVEVQLPPSEPVAAATPAPVAVAPAPVVEAPTAKASRPAGSAPVAQALAPDSKPMTAAAGSPALTAAPVPAAPDAPLTPAQRLVKNAPSIAKVKEFVADQGFVVLSSGSKQGIKAGTKFDIRRDASVVGRIAITSVDETESVADIDVRSVPTGVTVRPGDEIIGVVLQH